jgi:hypothetical protein
VAKFDPDSVGLNPNWRKSVAHIYVGIGWQEGAPVSEIKALRDGMRRQTDILDGLSPSSATYLNEVCHLHKNITVLANKSCYRRSYMNVISRRSSLVLITTDSDRSRRSTTPIPCSLLRVV